MLIEWFIYKQKVLRNQEEDTQRCMLSTAVEVTVAQKQLQRDGVIWLTVRRHTVCLGQGQNGSRSTGQVLTLLPQSTGTLLSSLLNSAQDLSCWNCATHIYHVSSRLK